MTVVADDRVTTLYYAIKKPTRHPHRCLVFHVAGWARQRSLRVPDPDLRPVSPRPPLPLILARAWWT